MSGSDADRSFEAAELREWMDALDDMLRREGSGRVIELLQRLDERARRRGVDVPSSPCTPYVNTIGAGAQPDYPGDLALEERITAIVRWNAMAMVVKANREEEGIGGHIASYASLATLYEMGFNHFFRGGDEPYTGDLVYFQGHSSPGVYARAFLEGRLPAGQVANFRHELHAAPGLPSYPHPWLMPSFWQFPTVSMGLGPIAAVYHARFVKYLEDRGLAAPSARKVWAFVGDGETDEPESLGSISLAGREKLNNLIFVVNCNLQRLDGPVRGNGKIIQELEGAFFGSGWRVIKVIWGSRWDALLYKDESGILAQRLGETVDGEWQKYTVESGAYFREHFFGVDPRLQAMVAAMTDEELKALCLDRGGHDPLKVYAAYRAAADHASGPVAILAQTIKGFGLGSAGEGMNVTHQQKKLDEGELRAFRDRFSIPLSDAQVASVPFFRPGPDSAEMRYLTERRRALGGALPARAPFRAALPLPPEETYREFFEGTGGHPVSTTMAFVRLLSKLLKDPHLGRLVVPIVPDEARTFGMQALFRQSGIYSHPGQLYEPVDKENLLFYREATDGQILEEGITEAGALASFIAAGTAYSNHGVCTVPFFLFYSMFGFQRVGDLIWAAADSRCKGFLLGATAGRTTLAGEGLQHQDGSSHLIAMTVPNLKAYDPAYAYEIAVIIQNGLDRMYGRGEEVFYYLTITNENYDQPPMPQGCREGIVKGMYLFRGPLDESRDPQVHLLGSGAILNEAVAAQEILRDRCGVHADVWSVTSYKELYADALSAERWNRLHPGQEPRTPYIARCLGAHPAPAVAACDYVKALPAALARWAPRGLAPLGTDGFGRSDGRPALRRFFEVDAASIAVAAIGEMARCKVIPIEDASRLIAELGIDTEGADQTLR